MKKYKYYLQTLALLIILQNFAFAGNHSTGKLVEEICDNRIDDDGDGLIDCLDPDCSGNETCWDCLTEFYQVHSNSYLVALDPHTGAYTNLGTISGASQVNGAQFNQVDGHVYAPVTVDGVQRLGMIQSNGKLIPLDIELPGSAIFYAGAIDARGKMYISNGSGVHYIDLKQETLEVVATGTDHPGVADFALDITKDLFYGINSAAQLVVFNPNNLSVSQYDLAGSITNDGGAFGACWSSRDGSFFAYNNSSGKIYSINPNDLTATLVLNGTGNLSINDGFNCVLAAPPFETKCGNMIDDDGDGLIDCEDPDCFNSNVCTVEICNNGIDDDNDGWIDCSDSECFDLEICVEICNNGIDDNNNGLIDADDPQCTTPSGVTGGLESNRRLTDKIAQRNFKTRVLYSDLFEQKLEGAMPFQNTSSRSAFEISNFIPTEFQNTFVAESAPIDLIEITNAIDVAGADYFLGDRRIATVLGIYSENGVYEHSKYICDRLDGSRLIDISYLFAYGGNFISYELINKQGQKEYAVSFSARLENENFHVENHWNLHKYDKGSNYFNFQIWGQSYPEIIALLDKVLHKMHTAAPIQSIEHSEIPYVFVTHGEYQNGRLNLGIKNKNQTTSMQFSSSLRRTETGELEDLNLDIAISPAYEQIISIETGPIYDLGGSLNFPESPSDEIFIADGSWGIDTENPDNYINSYQVATDERENLDDEYMVERSIELKAKVKNYLNIYRSLDAKLNAQNLSDYNNLQFLASGIGQVQVTIVKESISEWNQQFRTNIILGSNEKEFNLKLEDFSSSLDIPLVLDDATMLVFTILGNTDYSTDKEFTISDLSFNSQVISATTDSGSEIVNGIFPNPVHKNATLNFESNGGNIELQVYNAYGIRVIQNSIEAKKGVNEIEIDCAELSAGQYFYTISEKTKQINYGKFIKIKD